MPEIIKVNPVKPEQALIDKAVDILKAGGVIAYPTETFYGLGAHAGIQEAVERIFFIKGRAFANPVALILGDGAEIDRLVVETPPAAHRLMQAFWPGALTIVFKASPLIIPRLTAGTGRIGIRVSSHPIASALAKTLFFPVTATSANVTGEKECSTAGEVVQCLGNLVDAVIDGGITMGKSGSTVLDVTVRPPQVLREGAVSASLILAILKNNQ